MNDVISAHFRRREFACRCSCGFDTVDVQLINALESVRELFSLPIFIISGARCKAHNEEVGGAGGSMHLVGKAADFIIKGVSPSETFLNLKGLFPNKFGIGNYRRWTHLDVRPALARW